MEEKLKPCPFCGCKNRLQVKREHSVDGRVIECQNCYAVGPLGDDEAEARNFWNERKA
jgi:Lar family restriction alleviation protein